MRGTNVKPLEMFSSVVGIILKGFQEEVTSELSLERW